MTAGDVDGVLENIDEALAWEAQWERSAMRWVPDLEDEAPSDETFADLVRRGVVHTRPVHLAREAFRRHVNDPCPRDPREALSGTDRIQAAVARLAGSLGFALTPWQEAMVESVYQDLEHAPRWAHAIATPRPTPTVMYAFHDEDGLLRITSDPIAAAEAPGPVSIGYDSAAPREPAASWIDVDEMWARIEREDQPPEARRMWLNGWDEDGNPRAST